VFEAIFWDNDGVLVDTEGLYYRATRETLAAVAVDLSVDAYVELFLRQARGAWHLAEARGLSATEIDALRKRRDQRYATLLATAPIAIPGVAESLRRLSSSYRMAIVTSSEHFHHIHRDPEFLAMFEFVLTREDCQHCKPHPEPYLRALERTGLRAQQCLVVEDSERGLRSARAAGLPCWVVPSAFTRACAFEGADRILTSVAAVESALLG
jgi:HAD superfamily hydrolase (TIGR01509 family)